MRLSGHRLSSPPSRHCPAAADFQIRSRPRSFGAMAIWPPAPSIPRNESGELGLFPGQLKSLRVEGGFDVVGARLHEIKNGLHRGERLPPLEEQQCFDGA